MGRMDTASEMDHMVYLQPQQQPRSILYVITTLSAETRLDHPSEVEIKK